MGTAAPATWMGTIRKHLSLRCNKAMAAGQTREHTCGLLYFRLRLHTAHFKPLQRYFLIFLTHSAHGIKCIHMEQSYIHSVLCCIVPPHTQHLHITGMIVSQVAGRKQRRFRPYAGTVCPPCHAVGCVSHAGLENNADSLDVIINSLSKQIFCICDLSATPHAEKDTKICFCK